MPKGNQRLVHVLVGPSYEETRTLCGMRVPAVWDDIGLDTEEMVEFSASMADITCEFCRAYARRLKAAA